MRDLFPWLPLGTEIEHGVTVGRLLQAGKDFQLVLSSDSRSTILFLKRFPNPLHEKSSSRAIQSLVQGCVLRNFSYSDDEFAYGIFSRDDAPKRISSLVNSPGNQTTAALRPLAFALSELRSIEPRAIWAEALYIPTEKICLATTIADLPEPENDRFRLVVSLLVGAVTDLSLDIETIRKLNPSLETSEIREFLAVLGFQDAHLFSKFGNRRIPEPSQFHLPGRPELQEFFREYIIDFFYRFEDYRAMGFAPPNGVLLYGPPGSGKTFAVNKLAEFLKWPVFDVDIGGIGSPYIHETSKKLKQVFETAADQAPSIVLLEEIDALAGKRGDNAHESKVEEISQLLRLLEKAGSNGILVVATTNRYDALDSAIVRRGRFDHVIEVGFPSQIEISLALQNLLKQRPAESSIQTDELAELLKGRPMSDVAWIVNEAARFAVRLSRETIDQALLTEAISRLGESRSPRKL